VRIHSREISSGDVGADETARVIRGLISQGRRDPVVRSRALTILRARGVPEHKPLADIEALYSWVKRNLRYVRDPNQIEYIQTARRALETLSGDCDDYTVLLGSMLESIGFPVDVKVIARRGRRSFHHVYPVANVDGFQVGLDASMPIPFGAQFKNVSRQKLYRSELSGMKASAYEGFGQVVIDGPTGKTGSGETITVEPPLTKDGTILPPVSPEGPTVYLPPPGEALPGDITKPTVYQPPPGIVPKWPTVFQPPPTESLPKDVTEPTPYQPPPGGEAYSKPIKITVPGAKTAEAQEAGFPTWLAVGLLAAFVVPMLFKK
jgi:hypothetical protein